MTLKIESIFKDELKKWLVQIAGEMDVLTAKELREELNKIFNERQESIILDLQGLNYIDSTGLGVIIGAYGRMKEKEKEISIINPKQNILKLLTITGLDKIFIK